MIKKEKNKSQFSIIGSFLIIGATSVFLFYNIYNFYINSIEEKQAEEFINNPVVVDTPVIEETTEEIKEEIRRAGSLVAEDAGTVSPENNILTLTMENNAVVLLELIPA